MSSQRSKREEYAMQDHRTRDRHRRSRSRSLERRRHRRSRSRSRSKDRYNRRDKRYTSRRYRDDSRSRSRSKSRSKRHGRSRTPTRSNKSSHHSRSPSAERCDKEQNNKFMQEQVVSDNSKDSTYTASSSKQGYDNNYLENLPLPKRTREGAYYNLSTDEPIDKERIHREMEEKLRETLAREGKVYPPPKPEASHPVFANDGSFLEVFKKMQAAQQFPSATAPAAPMLPSVTTTSAAAHYVAVTAAGKSAPPPPIVGRRRGGKILKTGVVAKPKANAETSSDPKDFWALYLAEVNKYKNNACESESGNRPLVK